MEKVIIFSAPSGSGKTTVVRHLLEQVDDLEFSVSATTRPQREHEVDGADYYFLSENEFRRRIEAGEFLEYEEVYPGRFYGTLKSEVQRIWDRGKAVVFDVDVMGGINIKEHYGQKALAIFLRTPSFEELKKRLEGRNTENADEVKKRLDKAEYELGFQEKFDIVLINNVLEHTFTESESVVHYFLKN